MCNQTHWIPTPLLPLFMRTTCLMFCSVTIALTVMCYLLIIGVMWVVHCELSACIVRVMSLFIALRMFAWCELVLVCVLPQLGVCLIVLCTGCGYVYVWCTHHWDFWMLVCHVHHFAVRCVWFLLWVMHECYEGAVWVLVPWVFAECFCEF